MTGERASAPAGDIESSAAARPGERTVEPWLVALLACPVDRGAIRVDKDALICDVCGRRYPVRDGIPVMIADDAE